MKGCGFLRVGTFTCVIVACVAQGNMVEALRLKDEMINCGKPINLVVMKSLMKGVFCSRKFCYWFEFVFQLSLFSLFGC